MIIKGKIHKMENNINTDEIIPARYCNTINKKEIAQYCFYDIQKDFYKNVQSSDIIVAGKNFGCGSSRELAPAAIKATGISCIIAQSFAGIFYRNSINTGLMVIASDVLYDAVVSGMVIELDSCNHSIRLESGEIIHYQPDKNFVIEKIIEAGGLMELLKFKSGM